MCHLPWKVPAERPGFADLVPSSGLAVALGIGGAQPKRLKQKPVLKDFHIASPLRVETQRPPHFGTVWLAGIVEIRMVEIGQVGISYFLCNATPFEMDLRPGS